MLKKGTKIKAIGNPNLSIINDGNIWTIARVNKTEGLYYFTNGTITKAHNIDVFENWLHSVDSEKEDKFVIVE